MPSIRSLKYALLFAIFTLVAPLGYVQTAPAAQVSLAWTANSEPDLAGYKLYYGTQSRNYSNSVNLGKTTAYTVAGLQEGTTYYFALTAYNVSGSESDYSNEASKVISPSCTYSISSAGQSFSASGGSTTVSVTAPQGCAWSASSGVAWVTITSGSTGAGNGSVGLSVAPNNTASSRAAGISIAGKTFTMTQAAASTIVYTITASAGTGGSIYPSGTINVNRGASKTFTIKASNGYRIYAVVVDTHTVGTASSYTFTNVRANHAITALFRRK